MLLQLAVWQQRYALGSSSSSGAGPLSGVSEAAVVKALPYAVALAAALSLETPFMHIDALGSEMESAAAAKEAEQAGRSADDDPAAAAAAAQAAAVAAAAKAENKQRAQAASSAHFRFRSSHGDAISSLNVLCAYEAAAAAGEAEEFCAVNFLHARHLREMSQLRQQLCRTLLQLKQQQQQQQSKGLSVAHLPGLQQQDRRGVSSSSSSSDQALQLLQLLMSAVGQLGPEKLSQPLPEPSARTLEVLRRALAAGWCDQVRFP
jgi:ATP-dependent RNA helicase DHX37/DHR1